MATMYWTLLIISITGTFSLEARFHSIPMMTKDACVRAAKDAAANSSRHVKYICISSETGENIKFQKE